MAADWFFLVFLLVDLACLALMAWAGLKMAATAKAAAGKLQPAVRRARRTAVTGQRLAGSARESGLRIFGDAHALYSRLRRRANTVRVLVSELRPPPAQQEEAKELARAAQVTLAGGRQWAGKFAGLRRAARAASSRRGRTPER